jgi:Contractile injection system tube protein
MSTPKSSFTHPQPEGGNKKERPEKGVIWIGSKDDDNLQVMAQYNPKELQIDKNVPWQKKNQANQANPTGLHLEFTGAEGRTMSVELLFDEYEKPNGSVATAVAALNKMASVIKPSSTKEDERRPHLCIATWGGTVQGFRCVIESLSTKYTMFGADGAPLRATCTVKLKEADVVSMAKDTPTGAQPKP